MKKLLSLVLAFALVLTCGCFMASAESEYVQLKWAMGAGGPAPTDNAMVLEAANEISRAAIGVELTIDYLSGDQMQLSIQSGEVYDLYFTCSWMNETNKGISNGLFLGLSQEEIAEVAPGLYAAMSKDVWDLAESADGLVYAIPNKKDYAAENFLTYPADIAAELGYEIPDSIESWDEITDFLVDWKATMGENEYPVLIGGSPAGIDTSFDYISRAALIGVSYGTTEVICVFDDAGFRDRIETTAKWMELGLINPDCATLTENAIDSKTPHIGFAQAWDGYDGYTVSNGYNTGMTRFSGPVLNVDSIQGSMNALSSALAGDEVKIEAALKLLELIHTNQLYCDTLRYGVQGYHWNYVEFADGVGVQKTTAGNDGYGPWGFSWPAYFNCSIMVNQDQIDGKIAAPNFDQYETYYSVVADSAVASAMGGFKWDSSKWDSQLKEISNIKEKYWAVVTTGTVSINDVYDEMMGALYAAGLQDLIDDAQAQLDAYLAK